MSKKKSKNRRKTKHIRMNPNPGVVKQNAAVLDLANVLYTELLRIYSGVQGKDRGNTEKR
jgi:hypothetical protein